MAKTERTVSVRDCVLRSNAFGQRVDFFFKDRLGFAMDVRDAREFGEQILEACEEIEPEREPSSLKQLKGKPEREPSSLK